jgi:hypothetical protein
METGLQSEQNLSFKNKTLMAKSDNQPTLHNEKKVATIGDLLSNSNLQRCIYIPQANISWDDWNQQMDIKRFAKTLEVIKNLQNALYNPKDAKSRYVGLCVSKENLAQPGQIDLFWNVKQHDDNKTYVDKFKLKVYPSGSAMLEYSLINNKKKETFAKSYILKNNGLIVAVSDINMCLQGIAPCYKIT